MSLKHYRNLSKQLLKALKAGSAEAAERVSRNLPRLSGRPVEEVLAAEVGLQEVQHVVAREQGYAQWADLPGVDRAPFEDLVGLTDGELDCLLREVDQLDLITALKQIDAGVVSKRHQVCLALLQHCSERVRNYMLVEVQFLDASPQEIEEAQERILAAAERLGEQGQISWPPGTRTGPEPPPAPTPVPPAELQLLSQPLDSLTPEQVRRICHGLAAMAEAHGITSLEVALDDRTPDFVAQGVRLAADGTDPGLIRDLLGTRADTLTRYLQTRQRMITEGLAGIAGGDNPRIVEHKVATAYAVEPEEPYRAPEGTVELARQRLQRRPASAMTLHELAEFFSDVAWIARRVNAVGAEGLAVLRELADAVDDDLLAEGLRQVAALERVPAEMTAAYRERVVALVAGLEERKAVAAARTRYRMFTVGLAAVQEGKGGEALDAALDAALAD